MSRFKCILYYIIHHNDLQIKKPQNLDETYNKESSATSGTSHPLNQNSTFTKENSARVANTTVTSYDITPARHELPPEELIDEDNYDIGDLRSDEDTDDEDNPRKIIPKWAQSSQFKTAIMKQAFRPPDLDSIFFVMETSVELAEIFPIEKRRFKQRTSSAVWLKAPTTHNLDYTNKTNNLK
jgi:inner centromere protein